MPKVSVIIPTYNRLHYLCEAIESVLAQTFKDYEIIVVDDGSTDNTKQALEKYSPRIYYIYQENKGRAEARNAGIKIAKAAYITFLDDDDIWMPNKLEKQVLFLDSHPDIGLVHNFIEVIDEHGHPLEEETKKHLRLYKKAMKIGYTYAGMSKLCLMFTSTVMLRKECFEKTGLFDSDMEAFEDWDFYLRFALKYNIGIIPELLTRYRIHAGQSRRDEFTAGRIKISLKHLAIIESCGLFPLSKQISCNFYLHLANAYYINGQFTMFRTYALKTLKLNPPVIFQDSLGLRLLFSLLPIGVILMIRRLKPIYPERILPKETSGGPLASHLKRYDFAKAFCRDKIVLDAACGVGYGSAYLCEAAKEAIGVDMSGEAITYAKEHYQKENIQFKVMDIHNLEFPDKYFDIVCSFETLEHLNNPERFLSEVKRVLKVEGVLIVSTPQTKRTNYHPKNPYHKTEFSYKGFEELLKKYFINAGIFGQRRIQSNFHYYLQKIDILHFRALLSGSLRRKICHSLATRAWDEVDLCDFIISKNGINQAVEMIGVCKKKDNL